MFVGKINDLSVTIFVSITIILKLFYWGRFLCVRFLSTFVHLKTFLCVCVHFRCEYWCGVGSMVSVI